MEFEKTARARWWRWWPLLLVFVLSSFRWILEVRVPSSNSTALTEALGCAFAAVLALAEALRGSGQRLPANVLLQCGMAGALLIGGPLVSLLAVGGVEGGSLIMALAITPVVVTVAASAFGKVDTQSLAGRLRRWPARLRCL